MASAAPRRSAMVLYTSSTDIQSHRTRIVIAEKDITADIVEVDPANRPKELIELTNNLADSEILPVFVDRDLVLYESRVIMEYLDERFPYPPLMPVDPVSRAKARLALYHIENDWYKLLPDLQGKSERAASRARRALRDSLAASVDLFTMKPFFLSEEFSLLDCSIAPLLWRLPYWGIELPAAARPILEYAENMFNKSSFKQSILDDERDMRS